MKNKIKSTNKVKGGSHPQSKKSSTTTSSQKDKSVKRSITNSKTKSSNKKVAQVVERYNNELLRFTDVFKVNLVDLYSLTAGHDGHSNRIHHIDEFHLGPSSLGWLEKQISFHPLN